MQVSLLDIFGVPHGSSMAPDRVQVIVAPDSLRRTRSGAVVGQLWLRCEPAVGGAAREFPETGWWDFPVPVLAWWFNALAGATEGAAGVCRFMDGPFEFTLAARPGGRIAVSAAHEGEWLPAVQEFDAGLREAAAVVLDVCESRGWSSRDILDLRRAARRATHYRAG